MFLRSTIGIALTALLSLSVANSASAASTTCPGHFPGGQAPDITAASVDLKARELCDAAFAVLHSGTWRTPVYSAEHLTKESVALAKELTRPEPGPFHRDNRLPADERAVLRDYRGSGYDRGHMAPSGDMPTLNAQTESFSLANMVPQDGDNNQKLWRKIEAAVLDFAEKEGDLYVISGPIQLGEEVTLIRNRVQVPTNIFKAVYSPAQHRSAAYLVRNAPGPAWTQISLHQLEQMAGISVFPGLTADERSALLTLPDPERQQ